MQYCTVASRGNVITHHHQNSCSPRRVFIQGLISFSISSCSLFGEAYIVRRGNRRSGTSLSTSESVSWSTVPFSVYNKSAHVATSCEGR